MFALNNCSNYHEGSKLVWDVIKHFTKDFPNSKVIINGEGTLHNDTYRSRMLLEKAKTLKELGYKVYLINSVWQNNKYNNRYLDCFDRIYVRESLSQKEIQEAGYKAEVVPDLSLYKLKESGKSKLKYDNLVIDSVNKEQSQELEKLSKKLKCPFIKMCERSDVEELIKQSSFVHTGRFHGALLCVKHKIKFKAYKSNSHKMEGLVKDINGRPVTYLKNAQNSIERMFGEIKND